MIADALLANVAGAGDASLVLLGLYAESWKDIQKTRIAAGQRGDVLLEEALTKPETDAAKRLAKTLRAHPVWPWLSQYPGLGGVHVARLISIIGDPRRFPGQKCTEGHTQPPDFEVGESCPVIFDKETGEKCPGTMLEPRVTTGTRSLWHYLGLTPDSRKRKGVRCTWNTQGKTECLMPGGLGEQIVRQRVPKYRGIYDATKERLARERGAVEAPGIDAGCGAALPGVPDAGVGVESGRESGIGDSDGPDVDAHTEAEDEHGLRPIQIEGIARKVAVKAFVGDLLAELKRLAVVGGAPENVQDTGNGKSLASQETK